MRSLPLSLVRALVMMACSGVSVVTAENPSTAAVLITDALHAAEQAMQRHLKVSEEEQLEEVEQRISNLQEKVDSVQRSAAQAIQLQEQRDALIQQANAKQIQHLIGQLNRVSEQEQARRLAKKEDQSSGTPAQEEDSSKLPSDWQSQLDPARVLAESEEELEAWILSLMRDELENAAPLLSSSSPSSSSNAQHPVVDDDSDECWTTAAAVTEVQAALNRWTLDGIGRPDLLQPPQSEGEAAVAATRRIVHELTSPTYQPPRRQSAASLSWWHRYLPQDWEVALEWLFQTEYGVDHLPPSSLSSIPDHVYHTLGLQTSQAVTAPPETILQDSLLPGACWPVAMPNKDSNEAVPPTVTIRLPVPAATISAVTLDHVSHWLVSDRSSAPKRVRVYGYAPCSSPSDSCDDDGLGFRLSSKRWLADVTYNLDGDNIQTFDVAPAAAAETAGMVEDGSCSAAEEPATCGGGGGDGDGEDVSVAAVSLDILENWGHPDYTCLYRFRVHGEPVVA